MHDGISFDKILPSQLAETTLQNREFGHNACSTTSQFSLAGSYSKVKTTAITDSKNRNL
jgi:hypothetical protein